MELVLNEYEWAERRLAEHQLGTNPTETLTRIAKYYYANQYPKKEIRKLLDIFLVQCDPNTPLVHWSSILDRIVKNVSKYPIIQIDGVRIYQSELDIISNLKGAQLQRLAFTALCVSKYWDAVSDRNNHWLNTKDKDIFQLSNINTSTKRQCLMYGELRDAGLIRFSKKIDNLNVQLLFSQDTGDEAMFISDFRNIGYQYMRYIGGNFFECVNCGLVVKAKPKQKGRKQKYCPNCAVEIRIRQTVDSVMHHRMHKQK